MVSRIALVGSPWRGSSSNMVAPLGTAVSHGRARWGRELGLVRRAAIQTAGGPESTSAWRDRQSRFDRPRPCALPLYIPQEMPYAPLTNPEERRNGGRPVGHSAGHARSDGAQDPRRDGADARLRDRPASRTAE